jgi:hypothetical protein
MNEVLQYYRALIDDEVILVLGGLLFVFVFQVVVFRVAERSGVVAVVYFLASISLVGAPLIMAAMVASGRSLSISDLPVVWALLSFLVTIIGIACSGSPQRNSPPIRRGMKVSSG